MTIELRWEGLVSNSEGASGYLRVQSNACLQLSSSFVLTDRLLLERSQPYVCTQSACALSSFVCSIIGIDIFWGSLQNFITKKKEQIERRCPSVKHKWWRGASLWIFAAQQCLGQDTRMTRLPGALLTISFRGVRSRGGHTVVWPQQGFITPRPLPWIRYEVSCKSHNNKKLKKMVLD